MLEVDKYLAKEIANMKGKLITIGLSNKLLGCIEKNQAIVECMAMDATEYDKNKNYGLFGPTKVLGLKKIRKKFKKKKHHILIMNIKHIKRNVKTIIRDSIYITKENIYIYGAKKDFDVELLKKRYKRYKVIIDYTEYKNSYVLKINVTKAKNHKILDMFYYISDSIYNGVELFSDFLVK